MTAADVETIVVGAGVVGLAAARALAGAGGDVMVLERHARIGAETSSRNSEVIHAGLYYQPGSLRARLCVAGRDLLYRFAADNGVGVRRCGKLLVATSEADLARLEDIRRTAAANGVDDLRPLDRDAVRALEPEVACLSAVLSPSTGVIDSHGLMQALEGHISGLGGSIVLNTSVTAIERSGGVFRLQTVSHSAVAPSPYGLSRAAVGDGMAGSITCRRLVLAAGLGGTALADTFAWPRADYRAPRTYPVKGHYFSLAGPAPFRHLVYPMPQGAWLGIHLTLDHAGAAKFGPDLDWGAGAGKPNADYTFDDADCARRAAFVREIRRYWPGLPEDALQPGYTGLRPRIYARGEAAADFAVHGPIEHGVAGLVALYGIESPGLTSSLAIGDYVAGLMRSERGSGAL